MSQKKLNKYQTIAGLLMLYLENGKGKILGRFYGIITFVIAIGTFLIVGDGAEITLIDVVWYSFILLIILLILGALYSYSGLLEAELSAANKASPELMEIRSDVKLIKQKLGIE